MVYRSTTTNNMKNIQVKTISSGTWIQIQIVSITEGYSQILNLDGKWVNATSEPQIFEDEILTFGEYFSDDASAEEFMETKVFKSFLKIIKKNWV